MVSCTKVLNTSIAHGVSGINDSLFSRSIISNETHQKVMIISNLTGYGKASTLISDVSDQIKLNPEKFHDFVAALKEEGAWTKDIVSRVLKEYNNIKASGEVNL